MRRIMDIAPDDDERSALALWLEVPDLPEAYEVTFLSDSGKLVLRDLARIAAATKVDASNPNPNSAIYRCAQLDLLRRIHNMAGIRPSEE